MRGLSAQFLEAMYQGLQRGREKGYVEWDQKWISSPSTNTQEWLLMRLHQEVDELVIALNENNPKNVLREAADVANFAMFIADHIWQIVNYFCPDSAGIEGPVTEDKFGGRKQWGY